MFQLAGQSREARASSATRSTILSSRLLFTLFFATTLLAGCATGASLKVGEPAIPFTALAVDGKPVSLDSFKGQRNVVLVFYIGHT